MKKILIAILTFSSLTTYAQDGKTTCLLKVYPTPTSQESQIIQSIENKGYQIEYTTENYEFVVGQGNYVTLKNGNSLFDRNVFWALLINRNDSNWDSSAFYTNSTKGNSYSQVALEELKKLTPCPQ